MLARPAAGGLVTRGGVPFEGGRQHAPGGVVLVRPVVGERQIAPAGRPVDEAQERPGHTGSSHPVMVFYALGEELDGPFSGRIGQRYPRAKIEAIYKEGEQQYQEELPPGYRDAKDKAGNRKYGD